MLFRSLGLKNCTALTEEAYRSFAEQSNVCLSDLRGCEAMSDDFLEEMGRTMHIVSETGNPRAGREEQMLRALFQRIGEIYRGGETNPETIAEALETILEDHSAAVRSLEKWSITGNVPEHLVQGILLFIKRHSHFVKELRLVNNDQVTENTMRRLVNLNLKVERLHLVNCPTLTALTVSYLVLLPRLKELNVRDSSGIFSLAWKKHAHLQSSDYFGNYRKVGLTSPFQLVPALRLKARRTKQD